MKKRTANENKRQPGNATRKPRVDLSVDISPAQQASWHSRNRLAKERKGGRDLFRTELEIPVRELLTHEEELAGARKIGVCMARLSEILPRHPVGYCRFLTRMEEMANDLNSLFSWQPMRENIKSDLAGAKRALRRAEKMLSEDPDGAFAAFEKGFKILLRYPLDPETLYQWSKEVSDCQEFYGPLENLEKVQKVGKLLKRLVESIDQERDRLVMPNLRLVLREVFRFPTKGMLESDLFQEGFLGLNKAVFRFDPGRKLRFSTYATHWIRQSIRKALIDKSSLIRLPQALHEKRYRRHRKLSPEEVDRIHRLRSNMVMFSVMAADDDDNPVDVRDKRSADLPENLQTEIIPRVVAEAIRQLSESEREVVTRRFGLDGHRRQTLEEIGSQMHLSRERIRQIERSALEQMRECRELWETYEDLSAVETAALS
jgi:RNA polymerase sigma factor (sigma-70 family)